MRLTLLGTGTPAPSLERQSSGYVVEVEGETLVFDHGPGAHQRLIESGRRAVDVTRAFFTHLHYDHFMEYPRLVLQRWDMGAGRIADLDVYGPPPIARLSGLLFDEQGVFGPDIRARVEHPSSIDVFEARGGVLPRQRPAPRVIEIAPGHVIDGPGWRVTVGGAAHVQPQLDCVSYRVDADAGSICYSGDSGVCDALTELAHGCDILVHMNHHFSGTEPTAAYRAACGNHVDNAVMAQKAGVKALVLTHILPQIDRPGIREQIVHEIQKVFSGRVIWGEDLMELTVDGRGVSTIEDQ